MNCPKCNTPMEMTVTAGLKLPAKYVNQISKTVIKKKECGLRWANWEKARVWCSDCNYTEQGL